MRTKYTPGKSPPGTIPLIDVHGNNRGHVSRSSGQANVSRFSGMGCGAKLVTVAGGKKEWHAQRKVKS